MARNASGVYSLPSSVNPVVTRTTISTDWANTTLNDIKAEITLSLDRSGRGAMTAPLQLSTGTAALPSLTIDGDTNTGMYAVAADSLGFSTAGVNRMTVATAAVTVAASQLLLPIGVVGAPGLSFASDPDCGFYRAGADDIRLAVNGADKLTATASAITASVATALPNGSTIADTPTPLVVGTTGVAFTNSWGAGGYGAPRYWLDAMGYVNLDRSVVHAGTPTSSAFTLPSGYRPAARLWFALIDDNGAVTFADIATSGTVTIRSNTGGVNVHLNGIRFAVF